MKRTPRKQSVEAVEAAPRTATNAPATKLKKLRERAGVSARECADACGLTHANSFYRYEAVYRMGTSPIPDSVITAIMPILVGKGEPPVTADELLSISSAHALLKVHGRAASAPGRLLPQPVVAPVFPETETGTPLVVRFRAEKGVYMDMAALHKRTFGVAPITAAKDIKGEQFCVLVADGDQAGTVLQCVVPTAFSDRELQGKRVVLVSEREGQGLAEVIVGFVEGVAGNVRKIIDKASGRALSGEIYGVVVGSYMRE